MKYVFPLSNIPDNKMSYIGGKAKSLSLMIRNLKVNVPMGFAITSEAFNCSSNSSNNNVISILPDAVNEIKDVITNLNDSKTYAVRSSALNEDGSSNSFAGQYETITNVKRDGVFDAVVKVFESSRNDRVKSYSQSFGEEKSGIGIVIQEFVNPEFAGVLFTSDPITGSSSAMIGNYVHGEGENLVSGNMNAMEFKFSSIKYNYSGSDEFKPFGKVLYKYAGLIRDFYQTPVDIEWAVSDGKVYILQARPITTLQRLNIDTYFINGTYSDNKLLTRTNVGEIFMKPVSPMTFSVLEKINDVLGLPDWLDNVYGQPYMNISVMCSMLMGFGLSKESAFSKIKDLTGNLPEGTDIPVSTFNRKEMLRKIKSLLFPKNKSKLSKPERKIIVAAIPEISREHISNIQKINANADLLAYWNTKLLPSLNDGLSAILGECGLSMIPLFGTRQKISKVAGEDLANRLCGGCVGILDSMKPLLLLEDVISGTLSKDEYISICGHRSVNEMELMDERPYENPNFVETLITEHIKSNMNVHKMQEMQHEAFVASLKEFKDKYPSKSKWIDKNIAKFSEANRFREDIRNKGVFIFCVFREFLLAAGRINGIGNNIFMLTFEEVFSLLGGNNSATKNIATRLETFNRYNTYPQFPNLILGRFNPDEWMNSTNRRMDFYSSSTSDVSISPDIKGFPGASGVINGKVKVITNINDIDQLEPGDILVTTATNIGWTLVFPKLKAIVTDIGAPLSHAAIVAREFGIPAVVGCGNATTLLKTGDVVTIDGSKGIVIKE